MSGLCLLSDSPGEGEMAQGSKSHLFDDELPFLDVQQWGKRGQSFIQRSLFHESKTSDSLIVPRTINNSLSFDSFQKALLFSINPREQTRAIHKYSFNSLPY